MDNAYLSYIITEGFCCVYLLIILFRMNTSIGTERQVQTLKYMIYAFIVIIITDGIWAVNEGQLFSLPGGVVNFADSIYAASISMGCYLWFLYVITRLEPPFISNRKLDILVRIPVIIVILLDLSSIFTGWISTNNSNTYDQEGTFYTIHLAICSLYLLFAAVLSLLRAFRTHSRAERGEYIMYALCMFLPYSGGFFFDYFPTVPFLVLSLFLVINLLFLTAQDMQIFNDALTDLNNRRRLDQFLEKRLRDASEKEPLAIFMIDINAFKSINDTYGHMEGDDALRTVASALKDTARQFNAFIARYGGDEFCLVADVSKTAPEEIEAALHRNLAESQHRAEQVPKPYTLTASIGCAVCDHTESDIVALIKKVDTSLYAKKEAWHRQND
jgi:diguanylate cyclase (GGDEF)-like protein